MGNQDIHICAEYIEAVFQRASKPMEPLNFAPDWLDQPFKHKIYHDVETFHLPSNLPAQTLSMAEILARLTASERQAELQAGTLSFEALALFLLFAHGILSRRLDVNWNPDHAGRSRHATAIFARGTASGGGLYPAEIYWACGGSGPLLPGLYHYGSGHHALERLYTGDLTVHIQAAAAQHPLALASDQFLLISLNFWKNAFKYNSFCYHVVTQDSGALLASLRLLGLAFHIDIPFLFWFFDEAINLLAGLETFSESIFAIMPLPAISPLGSTTAPSPLRRNDAPGSVRPLPEGPLVRQAVYQRSKNVITFPTIERVHRATLLDNEPYPAGMSVAEAWTTPLPEETTALEQIHLPRPAEILLQADLLDAFTRRRSSFGHFQRSQAFTLSELGTILFFAYAANNYKTDLKSGPDAGHFTRLMVIVNRVQDLQSGIYSHDGAKQCLWMMRQEDLSARLQKHYFLRNYNLTEVGAVIIVLGKPQRMLEAYGNRGYRILNAEVGLTAQNIYMISAALSIDCGATLGFENMPFNKLLGLENTDERSMLLLLVGPGSKERADFDTRLF